MFKTKRVEAKNTLAIPAGIPRQQPPQTVIHHAPSYAGLCVVGFLCLIAFLYLGWNFLLYVAEEMGSRHPVRDVVGAFFGLAAILFASYVIDKIIGAITRYKLAAKEIDAETERYKAQQVALPLPGESRLTEEDSKFAALLRVVMEKAYRRLHSDGQYGRNESKPWSRRQCKGVEIAGFKDPVTEDMASKVSRWLEDKGVIDKTGLINDQDYPSFAHFLALLEEEYYTPIQVQKALSPILSSSGFGFTK